MQDCIVIYHNEHLWSNPAFEMAFGPFTKNEANKVLAGLCEDLNSSRSEEDGQFEHDGDGYVGIDREKHDTCIADEIWACIVPILPTPTRWLQDSQDQGE